jgi:cytochrome b6-f complex iron-sulfur subunit
MAEQKKLTTAEILALARKGGSAAQPAAESGASAEPREESKDPAATGAAQAPAASPAPTKPTPAKPGERPSVADILAAARAGKGAAPAPDKPPAAKPKPDAAKPSPAAKSETPAAAKTAAAKPAAAAPTAKDTASILAAARAQSQPGPMTKAQAAAREAAPVHREPAAKAALVAPPMPPKPEYAKPDRLKPKAPLADADDRRGFLSVMLGSMMGIGFVALSATAGLWTLGFARFLFPNILTEPPSRFKVGFPEGFAPGTVEERFKAQFGVWVVNAQYSGEQQLFALRTVCTHLGCTPNWLEAEQKFKCPCHGSGFYKDGINFEGPAPRPLERYAIRIAEDGQVEIDKSRLFQEEMGQWADPASFIARSA